jgi:hypothetical protein
MESKGAPDVEEQKSVSAITTIAVALDAPSEYSACSFRGRSISRFRTKNVNVVWWNFCDSVGEEWLSGLSQTHLHMFAKFSKFTILLS